MRWNSNGELGAAGHRLGQHRLAVGGEDPAAVAVEVADRGAGVARVVVEVVGPHDLDVVDHHEQGDVADDEADAEAR